MHEYVWMDGLMYSRQAKWTGGEARIWRMSTMWKDGKKDERGNGRMNVKMENTYI